MRHEKKCWPRFFDLILNGEKSFEVRIDEGLYHTGDTLVLQEYDPVMKAYTGRSVEREIGLVVNTKEQVFWPEGVAFQVMELIDPAKAPILHALPTASEEQIEAVTLALKQPDTQKVDAAREILSIESGQWTADIKFYLPARDEWMDCEYYGKKREKGSE